MASPAPAAGRHDDDDPVGPADPHGEATGQGRTREERTSNQGEARTSEKQRRTSERGGGADDGGGSVSSGSTPEIGRAHV